MTENWLSMFNQFGEDELSSEVPRFKLIEPTAGLVTIVIASRNRIVFLAEALKSIYRQDYRFPFTVIIVDDGSHEPYLLEQFPTPPSHVALKLLRNEVNQGPSFARNRGADEVISDFVVFADDDNLLLPDHLDRLVEKMCSNPTVIVTASLLMVPSAGPLRHDFEGYDFSRIALMVGDRLGSIGKLWNVVGDTNFIISRRLFKDCNGFNTDLIGLEDWEFLLRASSLGVPIVALSRETVIYRESNDGVQQTFGDSGKYHFLDRAVLHTPGSDISQLKIARSALEMLYASNRSQTRTTEDLFLEMNRLKSRRSVRMALRFSSALKPIFHFWRRKNSIRAKR
jgi:glycosyltransferase involved in cell wall biosynthesis